MHESAAAARRATSLSGAAIADPISPSWPDDPASRLAALALIETLDADLLSHDSATLTLERWCAAHRLAPAATVTAERDPLDKPPSEDQRRLLRVGATEPVRYRRVRLSCGPHVLSEADNWYVPGRLTPEMNRVLETSDTTFGRAVQGLNFTRRTLSAERLWHPLTEGRGVGAPSAPAQAGALAMPREILRHHALLTLPDGTPFSALVETYTSELLVFPRPPLP